MRITSYFIAYKKINAGGWASGKKILLFAAIACCTLVFVWPVGSDDIFSYIYQTRVLTEYGANPYFIAYENFPLDGFRAFVGNSWTSLTTPYAPLFVTIGAGLSFLGGNSPVLTLFLFKLFFAAIHLTNCFLIYKIFDNAKVLFLYAFNPLMLFEFAVNGHNDVLICLFLLLSFGFLAKRGVGGVKYYWSVFFLTLSVLIKFITAIFIPLYLFVLSLRPNTLGKKSTFIALSALILSATVILAYAPFWGGSETMARLILQMRSGNLVAPFLSSPLPVIFSFIFLLFGSTDPVRMSVIAGRAVFFLLYSAVFVFAFRRRPEAGTPLLAKCLFFSMLFFYASFFFLLPPWYLTTLVLASIICLALTAEEKYAGYAYALTFYGIVQYIFLR